jgi:hypothetical protein
MPSRNTNAIILAVLFPGLGHVYLGKPYRLKGIVYLVVAIGVAAFNIAFSAGFDTTNQILYAILPWAIWAGQLVDLIRIIRKEKKVEDSEAKFSKGQ